MDDHLKNLAKRAVNAANWCDVDGWLTHTTHAGGYPKCNAGIAIRADSNGTLSDAVTEGMFGPITLEPSHHHPDFAALYEQHERDIDAAWQRVLPDLSDAATVGCLLALVRKKHNDFSLCVVFDHDDGTWGVGRWEDGLALRAHSASTEVEALVLALEAV